MAGDSTTTSLPTLPAAALDRRPLDDPTGRACPGTIENIGSNPTKERGAARMEAKAREEPRNEPDDSSVALGEDVNRGAIAASAPPIARLALSATGSRSALRLRVRCDIVFAPGTRPALLPTQPSRRPCSVWDTGAPSEKAGGMERVARVNAPPQGLSLTSVARGLPRGCSLGRPATFPMARENSSAASKTAQIDEAGEFSHFTGDVRCMLLPLAGLSHHFFLSFFHLNTGGGFCR